MLTHINLDGETRLAGIIGDPIAQVKSPGALTASLNQRHKNWIVVPLHISPEDVSSFLHGIGLLKNFDGFVATIPHKFAAYEACATATATAHFLKAANVVRRNADGSWHGDMVDGLGLVNGLKTSNISPKGRRALLIGAGGAGSAIALALLDAGVLDLAIYDQSGERCAALVGWLQAAGRSNVSMAQDSDPAGRTLLVNATPMGMKAGDPLPIPAENLKSEMVVCDVITVPEMTPLLLEAAKRGCIIQTGSAMYSGLLGLMTEFLLDTQ